MSGFLIVMFSILAGLTLSGICGNSYWLIVKPTKSSTSNVSYWVMMAISGPAILIDRSTRSLLSKKTSLIMYALAIGTALYWAFAIGVLAFSVYTSIFHRISH
jgi:hypothetical protein